MKDPQQWSNKFFSQIIDIVNTNSKGGAFVEEDAFVDQRRAEEDWNNPRALIKLQPGGLDLLRNIEVGPAFHEGELIPWILALAGVCSAVLAVLAASPAALDRSLGLLLQKSGTPPLVVGNLSAAVSPPAYTGLPEAVYEGFDGNLVVYPGSRIRLSGEISAAADSGTLTLPDGSEISFPVGERRFEAAWIALGAGVYRLAFSREGRPLPLDFEPRSVTLRKDRRPEVKLEAPAADLEVFGETDLPVRFSARDDFSVESAVVVLSGDREVRVPVPIRPGPDVSAETVILPLSYPELGSGAYLSIEAVDGDTVSGPKTGVSRSVYLSFASREKRIEEIERMQERLFEQLLGQLADHLELAGGSLSDPDRARQNAEDLLKLLEALAEAVSRDEMNAESPATLTLLAMRSGLEALLRPFVQGGASGPAIVRELERDVLLLDRLMKSLRMEKALAMGDELEGLQQALFDRLADGADPAELLPLIQRIRELMARMTAMMTDPNAAMPESFVNSDALRNMPASELEQTMKELSEALRKGDREAASKLAEKLLEQMNSWMAALEDAAREASQSALGSMAAELDGLLEDLKEIIGNQEQIFDKTNELTRESMPGTARSSPEEARRFADRIEEHLRAITGGTRRMETLAPYRKLHGGGWKGKAGRSRFMEARTRMNAAVNEIRRRYRNDPNAAREAVGALENGFEDFAGELERVLGDDPNQEKARPLKEAVSGEIAELRAEFDRVLSPGARPPDPETARKSGELAERQGANAGRTGEFSRKLGETLRNLPLLPPDLDGEARRAGEAMDRSAGELAGGRPGGSLPHQSDALERLSEVAGRLQSARRRLQQGMSRGNGLQMVRGPGRGPGQGSEVDRSRVEIPREAEARELKGFREEVLKAMRSGPYPKDYESDVESYYEGLIK